MQGKKRSKFFGHSHMAIISILMVSSLCSCTISIKKIPSSPSCASQASGFAGGDGSIGNPYKVCNGKQLDLVRTLLDKNFIQTADIDLSASANGKSANWFLPIGTLDRSNSTLASIVSQSAGFFSGTYNGGGYKIKNFTYLPSTDVTRTYVGLFAVAASTSTISNVVLDNCNVSGDYIVGCLFAAALGTVSNITIKNSSVTESLIVDHTAVGLGANETHSGLALFAGEAFGEAQVDGLTITDSTVNVPTTNVVGGAIAVAFDTNDPGATPTIQNVTMDSVTVVASGLVGGLNGVTSGSSRGVLFTKINLNRMSISDTGNNPTSGLGMGGVVAGGAFGFFSAQASEVKVSNSIVNGIGIAGGVFGFIGQSDDDTTPADDDQFVVTKVSKILVTDTDVNSTEGTVDGGANMYSFACGAIGMSSTADDRIIMQKIGVRGGTMVATSVPTTDFVATSGIIGIQRGGQLSNAYTSGVTISSNRGSAAGFAATLNLATPLGFSDALYSANTSIDGGAGGQAGFSLINVGAITRTYSISGVADAASTILSGAQMSNQGANNMPGITDLIGSIWKWSTSIIPYPILSWEDDEEPVYSAADLYGTWDQNCILQGGGGYDVSVISFSSPDVLSVTTNHWNADATCSGAPDSTFGPTIGTFKTGELVGDRTLEYDYHFAGPIDGYSILQFNPAKTTYQVGENLGAVDDGSRSEKRHRAISGIATFTKR